MCRNRWKRPEETAKTAQQEQHRGEGERMAKWRALEEYTPFARLLVEYMWEQRPPLLPNQFADRMSVRKQALSTWLNSDAVPSPPVVVRLARGMGQPVRELMTATGYASADDPLLDRVDAWIYVRAEVERALDEEGQNEAAAGADAGVVSSQSREALFALMHQLQDRDEASVKARISSLASRSSENAESDDAPDPIAERDEQDTP
jgi:transcriptional regulator with XRE-family HTH domain